MEAVERTSVKCDEDLSPAHALEKKSKTVTQANGGDQDVNGN